MLRKFHKSWHLSLSSSLSFVAAAMIFISLFAITPPIFAQAPQSDSAAQSTPFDPASSDKDNFTRAFYALKRNDNLQFELPAAPPKPPRPIRKKWNVPQWLLGIFNVFGGIAQALFYLCIGMVVCAVLYLLGTTLMAARFETKQKKDEETLSPLYQPEAAQARILLKEIDALAAQGKYKEAVHTLLFRSIQDIDANRPNVVRRSLTSREIGSLDILTPTSRRVFSQIAYIVERSFFGTDEITKGDFNAARAAYVELTSKARSWAASSPAPQTHVKTAPSS